MTTEVLIKIWFDKWNNGDFINLPITENFEHVSPFGKVQGKEAYLKLVTENKDKFLGYSFKIHDSIFKPESACVRYTANQGLDFTLDVSEWYYIKNNLIEKVVAYYHIGEIRKERLYKTQ